MSKALRHFNVSGYRSHHGFTLIEVMVALAIFALIGVSLMQVTSVQLANALYLEQRLMSQWLAENLVNQIKSEPKKWQITQCSGSRSGSVEFIELQWTYKLSIKANPFNIKANPMTGDYGKKVCVLELDIYLPDASDEPINRYRGYMGVSA